MLSSSVAFHEETVDELRIFKRWLVCIYILTLSPSNNVRGDHSQEFFATKSSLLVETSIFSNSILIS
uniref:Uncharacterized protein n=1 Tax=Physcomitrium patens TaxID=3218 RepID=A0A2K1L758_PHYPA|nr:hypothetical protein PHYPA_000302 [Physcomitrium patens]